MIEFEKCSKRDVWPFLEIVSEFDRISEENCERLAQRFGLDSEAFALLIKIYRDAE